MSEQKRSIRREMRQHVEDIQGRVLSAPQLVQFNTGALEETWVCDVDIGATRVLSDVPIKLNGGKDRLYAQLGAAVTLRRMVGGRYQIIGPAERVTSPRKVVLLDEDSETTSEGVPQGFTFRREPFEYFKADSVPGNSLWGDGVTPFVVVTLLDGNGNPV